MMVKKDDIGLNAGEIWNLLYVKGALSIKKIGEFTHFREMLIYMSLGWLSRENKVHFFEKDGTTYVALNQSTPEVYY